LVNRRGPATASCGFAVLLGGSVILTLEPILMPVYLHLAPEAALPDISALTPFRAVIIVEAAASSTWQAVVSEWLVRSGCLYAMAWGPGCSSWDDSVDMANIEQFEFKEVPKNKFVMTTWHDLQEQRFPSDGRAEKHSIAAYCREE
jgi:hypothetical protein